MRLTLRQLLLLGLASAIVVALVPAGLVLDRSLSSELEESAREDLERAPMVVKDRNAARSDALMMHAREVAAAPGLRAALAGGAVPDGVEEVVAGSPAPGEAPVVVGPDGRSLVGPAPGDALVEAARRGESPVGFVATAEGLFAVSIAPVPADPSSGAGPAGGDASWVGAAGVAAPIDQGTAGTLAGLTAADVVILAGSRVVASTLGDTAAVAVARRAAALPADGTVREEEVAGRRQWLAVAPLGDVARVVFVVDAGRELAILPELRRGAVLAGTLALILALALGAVAATALARPVRGLATAADRLAAGDFHAPLAPSRVEEVDRMARAFARMRSSLQARLEELSEANTELAERQERLQALQAELIRRDRLAASGRLVAELAHEIRNPVANIRNCLEVVHRRVSDDAEARRFVDLAIDELLRMHELAEQMLDLNRPIDPGAARADPGEVVAQVAALYRAGGDGRWPLDLEVEPVPPVAVPPDTLKQVLLNLVQNAREAMEGGGRVRLSVGRRNDRAVIEVTDEGPGVPEEVLDRIFDPFFTTKSEVSGVGLGLFIAQGLVTRSKGRLEVENLEGGGARFVLELPLADRSGTPVLKGGEGEHDD